MDANIPGAFPDVDTRYSQLQEHQAGIGCEPYTTFGFSPLKGKRESLYPSLENLTSPSHTQCNYLSNQCEQMGYSNKLSKNVLSELDQRASTKLNLSSAHTSPVKSSPFRQHPSPGFNKMESISAHYAARHNTNGPQFVAIREDNAENTQPQKQYEPHSKRFMDTKISTITKKRKTEVGLPTTHSQLSKPYQQGTLSSSRRMSNLSSVLNGRRTTRPLPPNNSRLTAPTAASQGKERRSGVPTSSSFRFSTKLKPSATPASITNTRQMSNITNTIHINPSKSKMTRSQTLENIMKPTVSSLSKSTSARSGLDSSSGSSIPHSESMRFGSFQNRPGWR